MILRKLLLISLILTVFSCSKKTIKNDLGTFHTEEEAFGFTKNTLQFISEECNNGIKSATYLNEFENTKLTIFKNPNHEQNNHP